MNKAYFVCDICDSKVEIGGPDYYIWCFDHGAEGDRHGIIDWILRKFFNKRGE